MAALESSFAKLDAKVDKLTDLVRDFALKTSERLGAIENRLTAIETTLQSKADKADLARIEAKLEGKADKADLTRIEAALEGKADKSDLATIEASLRSKAERSDLTPIEARLGTVDGRVSTLPGIPAMITLVVATVAISLGGAAGLAFTLFRTFGGRGP